MNEAVKSRAPEAFFANAEDPLHNAFKAKAAIHSGPGGMPLLGEDARKRLLELSDKPRTGKSLAYIHVPFCETRCLYCMFYQNPFKEEAVHEYAKKLVREIEMWSDKASQNAYPVHAVYFGGGTPTAFSPDDLRLVLGALKKYLPLANDCEITLEGRIHNFGDAKMEAALEGGVNRFSLGVQTFNSQVRQSVQRVDDRETILKRLNKLCAYDNAAVVLDLIYGFPGQTMEVWNDDLKTAASLPLDGIDCYQLNVFEKSPLARYIANGKLPAAADQAQKADMFARSVEYLTEQNWRRLSNNHWANNTRERNIYNALGKSACDCLAFGCGAGERTWFIKMVSSFKWGVQTNPNHAIALRKKTHESCCALRAARTERMLIIRRARKISNRKTAAAGKRTEGTLFCAAGAKCRLAVESAVWYTHKIRLQMRRKTL